MHTVETIIETAGTTPLSDWPVWICLMVLSAIVAVYTADLNYPWRQKRKAPGSSRPGAVAERLVPGGVSHRISGQSKSEVVPAVKLSHNGKGLKVN